MAAKYKYLAHYLLSDDIWRELVANGPVWMSHELLCRWYDQNLLVMWIGIAVMICLGEYINVWRADMFGGLILGMVEL